MSEMIKIFKERLHQQRAKILALDDMFIEITKSSANFAGSDDADMDVGVVGSFRKLEVDQRKIEKKMKTKNVNEYIYLNYYLILYFTKSTFYF